MRLEFLPFTALMLGAGAAAGAVHARSFDAALALLAFVCLFLIQLAAVLTNEHFDFPGDRINRNPGRFSGGSRVIVTGALSHEEILRAVAVAVALLGACSGLLLALSPHETRVTTLVLIALAATLGLAHTAPPLKLSHRALGEINAAFTLGVLPSVIGWVTQGGALGDSLPWLIAMPMFCALLCARTLAGIPDIQADTAVRRRTYAVVFGTRGAAGIGIFSALAASLAGVLLWQDRIITGWPGVAFLVTVPHALALVATLVPLLRAPEHERPMDGILVNALLYASWFGLIPLLYFARLVRG